MNYRIYIWVSLLLGLSLQSQGQVYLDRIIAIVGEEAILESDLNNQLNYLMINGQKDEDGTLRCQIMEQLIISKLLLNKARQDSVTVSPEEVEAEIDRRMNSVIQRMGGDSKEFEKIYGKSTAQFRVDVRKEIEDGLLVERQRGVLISEADITPREVKQFFRNLPKDSLGFLPAEVQLNHILIKPPFSPESKNEARLALKKVREQILNEDQDFGLMAKKNSDGPSSAQLGSLGEVRRNQMVAEFEEVIFNMREGEVSEIFETEFGFHIAKVQKIRGQIITCSHILKIPKRSPNADSIAMDSLKKILAKVANDSLTFEQAAIYYSQDRMTKDCGGCILNPQTGELRIPMDALDPDLYFKIDEMEEGEISDAMEYRMPDGSTAFHSIYVKRKIPPHVPNLKDDYKKIRNAALQLKQSEDFEKWLIAARKNIYIDIKPTECINALKSWTQ